MTSNTNNLFGHPAPETDLVAEIVVMETGRTSERLRAVAQQLAVAPDELARAAFLDLLAQPDAEFEEVAQFVLRKNRELYDRLS